MRLHPALAALAAALTFVSGSARAAEIDVPAIYLEVGVERPPTLSNLDPIPEDLARSAQSWR